MEIEDIKIIIQDVVMGKIKICFFVGAGISKDYDQGGELCKDFKGFNEAVLKSIAGEEKKLEQSFEEKIRDNQRARPEIVLQLAKEEISDKAISSVDILLGDNLNSYHRLLARALKAGSYVFTTNFENRIEKACEEIGYKPNVCIIDKDYYKFLSKYINNENFDEGYIFKLHGSIDEEENSFEKRFESIIIALNDVGKGLSKYKKETMEKFLQNYDFIFMGYNCMDEFDINDVLLLTKSDKKIIFFQYEEEKKSFRTISDKSKLENEIKINRDKDRSIIHINNLIIGRKNSCKVVNNTQEFIKDIYKNISKSDHVDLPILIKKGDEVLFPWSENIAPDKKRLFFGRLLLNLGLWEDAISCFSKVQKKDKNAYARALRFIGDAYRETEEKSLYEKSIQSYKESNELFDEIGDYSSAEGAKVQLANVMRLAGKELERPEKITLESKQFFEKDILSDYAACLNILGLINYYNRSKKENMEGYYLDVANNLINKSMKIGEIIGDKSRVARAGNALSLMLNEQAKLYNDRSLAEYGIKILRDILPGREAASDLRLCFQINRNIGVLYETLGSLCKKKNERRDNNKSALKYYENAIKYAKEGNLRLGQYLEIKFRTGKLKYEDGDHANSLIDLNYYVENQKNRDRRATGERYIGLIQSDKDNEEALKNFVDIISTYEKILDDEKMDFLKNPNRINRAKENISCSIDFFRKNNDTMMLDKAERLLDQIAYDS